MACVFGAGPADTVAPSRRESHDLLVRGAAAFHRVNETLPWQLLANAVLALHVAIVVFVVAGLGFVVVGNLRAWRWVNSPWFRLAHLLAIAVVVAQAWLGSVCPLTSVEMWLRVQARETTYTGSFIQHWLQRLLYYEQPAWVFTLGYSLFGMAVVAAWWYFPPRFKRHEGRSRDKQA